MIRLRRRALLPDASTHIRIYRSTGSRLLFSPFFVSFGYKTFLLGSGPLRLSVPARDALVRVFSVFRGRKAVTRGSWPVSRSKICENRRNLRMNRSDRPIKTMIPLRLGVPARDHSLGLWPCFSGKATFFSNSASLVPPFVRCTPWLRLHATGKSELDPLFDTLASMQSELAFVDVTLDPGDVTLHLEDVTFHLHHGKRAFHRRKLHPGDVKRYPGNMKLPFIEIKRAFHEMKLHLVDVMLTLGEMTLHPGNVRRAFVEIERAKRKRRPAKSYSGPAERKGNGAITGRLGCPGGGRSARTCDRSHP